MATDTLTISARNTGIALVSVGNWLRPMHRLAVLMRYHRRQRARRYRLAQVLAETSDPRLIEDAGFRRPDPSILGLWARSLLDHRLAGITVRSQD